MEGSEGSEGGSEGEEESEDGSEGEEGSEEESVDLGYSPEDLSSEEMTMGRFKQWVAEHGKTYNDDHEKQTRFEIFKDNLHYIHNRNQQDLPYKLGLNEFADLRCDELKATCNCLGGPHPKKEVKTSSNCLRMELTSHVSNIGNFSGLQTPVGAVESNSTMSFAHVFSSHGSDQEGREKTELLDLNLPACPGDMSAFKLWKTDHLSAAWALANLTAGEFVGIERNCSSEEIRAAYKKLALKLHPDKHKGDEAATARFQELQRAYEVLSDLRERSWYDSHRSQILFSSSSLKPASGGTSIRAADGGRWKPNPLSTVKENFIVYEDNFQKAEEALYEECIRVPRRPPWHANMSAEELDVKERQSILNWRRSLARLENADDATLNFIVALEIAYGRQALEAAVESLRGESNENWMEGWVREMPYNRSVGRFAGLEVLKLILSLCLSEGFDTFPSLLFVDGCSMFDRMAEFAVSVLEVGGGVFEDVVSTAEFKYYVAETGTVVSQLLGIATEMVRPGIVAREFKGNATSAAGGFRVEDGILMVIWPHSGHFLPTEQNFTELLNFLEQNEIDLSNVECWESTSALTSNCFGN